MSGLASTWPFGRWQLQTLSKRFGRLGYLWLAVIAVLFRLPRLINAADMNADYGIIGLQAMHVLRGEWSWYVWGTSYQSSLEPLILALLFKVFGPQPVLVLVEPLLGHLLQLYFVHDILVRRLNRPAAFFASLPLTVTPWAATWLSLYGPRQLAVAVSFAGIWLIERAADRHGLRRYTSYVVGGILPVIAVYLDIFTLQFLPGILLFTAMCVFDAKAHWMRALGRFAFFVLGLGLGYGLYKLVTMAGPPVTQETCWGVDKASANLKNLTDSLPAAIGRTVWIPGDKLYPDLWKPPPAFEKLQTLGALSFGAFYVFANIASAFSKVSWAVKRLGFLAVSSAVVCLVGFTVSCKVGDIWAMRFLAPLLWFSPFALASLFAVFRWRLSALFIAPYLISATVTGWLAYGPAVRGPRIILTPRGSARDEYWLGEALRQRGVHHATAEFFMSYRLSFLWREDPIVVPIEHGGDRYPPHRAAFNAAKKIAYVFHPYEPRAVPETYVKILKARGTPFELEKIAGFTVIIHEQ